VVPETDNTRSVNSDSSQKKFPAKNPPLSLKARFSKTLSNLTNKISVKDTNEEEEENEIIVEKQKFKTKTVNIGWDCSVTAEQFNSEQNVFDSDLFHIFLSNEKIFVIKDIPKLSLAEKGLYSEVFDYIKDLPLLNIEEDTKRYFRQYCEQNNLLIDKEQADYIINMLLYEVTGFGPLTTILQDKDNLEEIAIVGLGKENPVYVYLAKQGWLKTNVFFTDEDYVRELINRMSRVIGRRVTLNQPLMNASLPDGSRLNAIIPPISNTHPIATLRRFRYNPLTPLDLIEFGTMSKEIAAFLWLTMHTDANILIVGNTGSGKTTTLNALFSFVPKDERIIVVEETPEVNIPHQHKVRLRTDVNLDINMNELIKSTLRMRPDRLIVGEIRDAEEVHSFLDTILAGQGKGSFATFHGLSNQDAIQRLLKLGMLEQDLNALDLIIVQRRWTVYDMKTNTKQEIRKIINISEIINNSLVDIFSYDYNQNKWKFNKTERMKNKIEIAFGQKFWDVYDIMNSKIDLLCKENKKQHFSLNDFFEKVG